jgi:hypothetical protein
MYHKIYDMQRRMKAIAAAAYEGDEIAEEMFGANDGDWDVYLTMVYTLENY